MLVLRTYQKEAVEATLKHFRTSKEPAVIVLPTGAGKSLVIAELARLARGRVLVLAHVKELVEQNYKKFTELSSDFGLGAGIFSAGLDRKDKDSKVIFGSIQSIARASDDFFDNFSLMVIDECHRVSIESETQYLQVISKIKERNPALCILGLTATPYRLGLGWIYQYHQNKKILRTEEQRFFKKCIYELPLAFMINNDYLTPPVKIDSPVACYDFSSLVTQGMRYVQSQIESILKDQSRITPVIIQNILDLSKDRQGVMIFTSTVQHAEEIMGYLPKTESALVIGDTESEERDGIINDFKARRLKYLVNVSVLTTGFDAPHVDVIAILRPTESVSLYQQIIGRGLRLSSDKKDCLILDYTGQNHDIYSPEIEEDKPYSNSEIVDVPCPQCGAINHFWGLKNKNGEIAEHYGRRCQGAFEDPLDGSIEKCDYLFRSKICDQCGKENDISARKCKSCSHQLVDIDKKLKEAMTLKDAHVMRVEEMYLKSGLDKKKQERLEIQYYDANGESLKEYFYFNRPDSHKAFYYNFLRMHLKCPEKALFIKNPDEVLKHQDKIKKPLFIVARKKEKFWVIREKVFDTDLMG